MRKFPLLVVAFCICFSLVSFAAASEPAPCPAESSVVVLDSSAEGYVCLGNEAFAKLHESTEYGFSSFSLNSWYERLGNGEDIASLLSEIEGNDRWASTKDEHLLNAVLSDRLKKRAATLCGMTHEAPKLSVDRAGLYRDGGITARCEYAPGTETGYTAPPALSVAWENEFGEHMGYVGSGGSFSGMTVEHFGTGRHELRCEYRPTVCESPRTVVGTVTVATPASSSSSSQSIARRWNEIVLDSIRKDRVRPPVQARNLFHISAAFYDIWALYHPGNEPYLFGKNQSIATCRLPSEALSRLRKPGHADEQVNRAISYAAYRMIRDRYIESPWYAFSVAEADDLMNRLAFDREDGHWDLAFDPESADATTLGNAVAECYRDYGMTDGSNEAGETTLPDETGSYSNQFYVPLNPAIDPSASGNPNIVDWNRWQPIALSIFIDQAGNPIVGGAATAIGPEWGSVTPFSLRPDQKTIHTRDGHDYPTYLDPGLPPQATGATFDLYRWNFSLVGVWSSHLDPLDTTMIDISPAHLGNAAPLPTTFSGMVDYYDLQNGGVKTLGRPVNPATHEPYAPNIVSRGDYTRVVAEFWADGPNSETPPGHWFTIFNAVSDRIPEKHIEWTGRVVDDLEWDVKGYFALGGALHDAAIGAWGVKGAYDGVRPLSAIRAMADRGQSSDPALPSYDPMGLPLVPGSIEIVGTGDTLAGKGGKNIGKIKMRAWRGPKYVFDPETDAGGVDWILADRWWPYQRPSFVTPPFPGYVSGHSTFSRAAAEVLTAYTGDEYFPGGLFEFHTKASQYLVFERGPTHDVTLQWATYRDAANESALSRIWGGIHPPMDDIPWRIMGEKIGRQAYAYAKTFFAK